tara:strand:+ start:208 stop:741 length:534 start_codon:yes stop_codon:yes gene_type:complete
MSEKDKKPKAPSIFTMAKNFAGELAEYIKQGAPNVSNKQYQERLEACNTCPHLLKESMRCGLCGCMLEHKAKWKTTTCPDKPPRWKAMFLSKEEIKMKEEYERKKEEERIKKQAEKGKRTLRTATGKAFQWESMTGIKTVKGNTPYITNKKNWEESEEGKKWLKNDKRKKGKKDSDK